MSYYIGEIVKLRADFLNAHKKGDYIQAIIAGEKIIKKYEENGDKDSIDYSIDMYNLGVAHDDVNNYPAAIDCYMKAKDIREKKNQKTVEYANIINNLAIDLSIMGKNKEALPLMKEAILIFDKNYGSSHIDYILALYNIGNIYADVKDYNKAIDYLRRALVKAQRKNGFLKNDYADIYSSLAKCFERLGNYREAIRNYNNSIEVIENNLDTKSFYYMSVLVSASLVCEKAKFYDKAIKYSERALEIRTSIMEEKHLDYITSLNALASLYTKSKNYKKAMEKHEEILGLVKDMLGEEHAFYADSINNIGVDYGNMEDYENAIKYHEKALEIKNKIMGEDSANIAVTYISLGNIYSKMKEKEKAVEAYQKALEIRKNYYGEGNLYYIEVLNAIGKFYCDLGDYVESCDYYMKAMMLRSTIAEKSSMGYVKNLMEMTEVFSKAGKKKQALDLIQDGITIRKKIYGEKHPKYADVLFAKAEILMNGKDYAKAQSILEDIVVIREEMLGSDSVDFKEALSLYADACRLSGNYDEAINCYERSIDLNFEQDYEDKLKVAKEKVKVALAIFGKGDIKRANMYYKKAVSYYTRNKIPEDDFLYDSVLECVRYNIKSKFYNEANIILDKAEKICENIYDSKSSKALDLYILKAQILYDWGKDREAIDYIENILSLFNSDNDDESKSVTKLYIMLSDLYLKGNDNENALYNLLKAEKTAKEKDYVSVQNSMGDIYFSNNEYDKAIKRFEISKNFMEEYKMTDTLEYIHVHDILGDIYKIKDDKDNVIKMYEIAVLKRKKLDKKDIVYINESLMLGEIWSGKENDKKALEYFSESAVTICELSGEDKTYGAVLMRIGSIYEKQSKFEEAYGMFKKAERILKMRTGEKSVEYLQALGKRADIEYEKGNKDEALDIYEKLYLTSKKDNVKDIFDKEKYEKLSKLYKDNKDYKSLLKLKFRR